MSYSSEFVRYGENGFVNITSNEMGIGPNNSDPTHQLYLDAVPFAVAAWNTEPWHDWPGVDRTVLLPYLDRHLTRRRAVATSARRERDCERKGSETLYPVIKTSDTIRLFELMPSSAHHGLHGTLHEVDIGFAWPEISVGETMAALRSTNFGISLSSCKPICYTALSYFWGPPNYDKTITIKGVEKKITSALHEALTYLRHEKHSVLLWVDQLCIDQGNSADKEAQITLMGKIYSRAWNTVIWLGSDSYEGAVKALEGMYEILRYRNDGRLLEQEIKDVLYPPAGEDEEALRNLKILLRQPWFKRTWVIQEACLSRKAFLMTGHTATPWIDFTTWCRVVANTMKIDQEPTLNEEQGAIEAPHIDGLQAAAQLDHLSDSNDDRLLHTLVATRYAQVSQPLDKVFGILGLCNSRISVDYSKDPIALCNEVALEVVKDAIDIKTQRSNLFYLLCSVDHEPSSRLASWAVDWTRPRVTTSLGFDAFNADYYCAGGTTGTDFACRLDGKTMTLQLPSKLLGTVQQLSDVFLSADLSADNCLSYNDSLRQAISFATSRFGNSSGDAFLTLCQTLVAGRDGVDKVRYPHHFTEILSLLCDQTTGNRPSFPGQTYTPRQQKGYFTTANLKTRSTGRVFQSLKRAHKTAMLHRRLCWSEEGHLGLVPRHTRVGDVLCVLLGSVVPFVVRRRTAGDYMLVGECYVRDLMQGQLLRDDAAAQVDIRLR